MQAINFLSVYKFVTPQSFDAGEIRVVELEHRRQGDSAAGTTMSCITDVECTNWDKSGKAEL